MIVPASLSQNLAASLETVVFPPPDGPINAVTSPCFAVKLTSESTCSPFSQAKAMWSHLMAWPLFVSVLLPVSSS